MIHTVSKAKSNEIVSGFYDLLSQAYAPPSPLNPESREYQANSQAWAADEYAVEFARKINEKSLDSYDRRLMDETLGKLGINLTSYPYNVQKVILESVSEAYFEHARRVEGVGTPAGKYQNDIEGDELEASNLQLIAIAQSPSVAHPPAPPSALNEGSSVGFLVSEYIEQGCTYGHSSRGPWGDTSISVNKKILGWFSEFVGPDLNVRLITNDHGLEFRARLLTVRLGASADTSFAEAQTEIHSQRISAATAANQIGYLKAFITWLREEGRIDKYPFGKLKIQVQKKQKSEEIRPFTKSEINVLFTSPLYRGFKSPYSRYKPGKLGPVRDGMFWLPLILCHTGMRIGEASEIPIKNVIVDSSTPHFIITEAKTYAGERLVPIHKDLLKFGFEDWVKRLEKKYGISKPLMSDMSTKGRLKNYASKWLGRYIDRTVNPDPTLVTHSFRHYFKDRARDAFIPSYIQDQIIGHEGEKYVGDGYGNGASLEVLCEAMNKIDFGLSNEVVEHLKAVH